MGLFASEQKLHEWFREAISKEDSLADLVVNPDYLENFRPNSDAERILRDGFARSLRVCAITHTLCDNENISMKKGEVLRPDFVLYGLEGEGLIIVELKNLQGPTRQAATELAAYDAEMRNYLPFIADGDVINVVVSTEWPALLRHYVFHHAYWLRREILCLEPIQTANGIRLQIKDIRKLVEAESLIRIEERNLGGYQICLYGDGRSEEEMDGKLAQMRTAVAAMAAKGNALRSHGFAFLWRDNWELSQAPYSITILNAAPFQGVGRFLRELQEGDDLPPIQERLISLVSEYNPEGHSETLDDVSAFGCNFLKMFCRPRYEGFTSWGPLRKIMLGRCELVSFAGWGLFGERHYDRLLSEYADGNTIILADDPNIGLKLVDSLVDLENEHFIDVTWFNYDPEETFT
ncbi:hypothetical protein K7H13_04960 [Qipengyuania citrea]|uniref:hypothetical protein n=1 Tax=Qipengyuania citrea TaxID=225971 RepID=UPI001E4F24FE|nr:hypothetical protein [Qipengyuania citrea]MCD1590110.1 hypothetical protein [Qipengyuania citrea]